MKDFFETILGIFAGGIGCVVYLAAWGIGMILALMVGGWVLNLIF